MPFGSWRTAAGRSVDEYLMVIFKEPVELSEMQVRLVQLELEVGLADG